MALNPHIGPLRLRLIQSSAVIAILIAAIPSAFAQPIAGQPGTAPVGPTPMPPVPGGASPQKKPPTTNEGTPPSAATPQPGVQPAPGAPALPDDDLQNPAYIPGYRR